MKIIRYTDSQGRIGTGSLKADGTATVLEGDLYAGYKDTGKVADVKKRLAPVVPTGIWCIGLNYRHHAAESQVQPPAFPVLFMKGLGSVQNPGDPIELPTKLKSDEVDYECELAVVIGRAAKNVSKANALDYVAGYTCANDISARDWQNKRGGSQWTRGKTFDTFCPLGPTLVTPQDIPNPNTLQIKTILNGQTLQDWNTNDMIFDVPTLIEFLSGSTTLPAGTVILTGTPHGVGMARKPPVWLKAGDSITISIEKIGELTNPIIDEPAAR